jgi:hypothetical protein
MPSILSRNRSLHQPRRAKLSLQRSVLKVAATPPLSPDLSPYSSMRVLDHSPLPATAAAAAGVSLPDVEGSNECSTGIAARLMFPGEHGEDNDDEWGQFVDLADAEWDMIRHSKILSQKYSVR